MFNYRAKERKIKFLVEIEDAVPKKFTTDSRRLIQILMNLIGNAFKFTFTGYIKVMVGVVKI